MTWGGTGVSGFRAGGRHHHRSDMRRRELARTPEVVGSYERKEGRKEGRKKETYRLIQEAPPRILIRFSAYSSSQNPSSIVGSLQPTTHAQHVATAAS